MDIPRGEIGPGAAPRRTHARSASAGPGAGGRGRMPAPTRLDAGLLVGTHDVVPWAQGPSLPAPLAYRSRIRPGLGGERGIAREDPAAMAPGPQRILAQPPPKRGPADLATSPCAITSRRSSASDQRASGTPRRAGSSHASALTSTTTLGGKAGWAPAAGLLLQPRQAFGAEALAPLADDLARGIETGRDDVIGQPRGGEQHDLRANHVSIR